MKKTTKFSEKLPPANICVYICLQIDCPEFPEDLKHWISFISASSQALRAESGLEDKSKWSHTVYHSVDPHIFYIARKYTVYIPTHKRVNMVERF